MTSPLHKSAPHESALRHVSGSAMYVDDLPEPRGLLHAWIVTSPQAHATIVDTNADKARAMPGVLAVLFADDIPGDKHWGPILHDEPLLAIDKVECVGQAVAVVIAESLEHARLGAAAVHVDYAPLPAILDIESAIAAGSYLTEPHVIARADVDSALAAAPHRVQATVTSGGQDHFYLESQAALVLPEEDGNYRVISSTQHPTEVQFTVAHCLGIASHRVVCEVPRMGGAFGGKESQATTFAALAALGVLVTGRPVKIRLNRDQDMEQTGNRHPFLSRYDAGFSADGRLLALRVDIWADGGWSSDLSAPILDRALFHIDNSYFIPALRFEGRACKTNLPSNTAFRGFGGPQGMLVVEDAINRMAERLTMDSAELRARNFYEDLPVNGSPGALRNRAPYGQLIENIRLQRIFAELMESSAYQSRRAEIDKFNALNRFAKRGLAFGPVKFGISFTKSFLNQAGAMVLVYADGSVQLNHGGTEMGQGLHTKMLAVCAHELGVQVDSIRVMQSSTDKVPNTSATAASSGSDLNGRAVQQACQILIERMRPVAADMLGAADPESIVFEDGIVRSPNGREAKFGSLAAQCRLEQVSLSATGYWRTPGIAYDADAGQGRPFYYYAFGGAVSEVEVNGLTGEHRLLRVDILHDVGSALVPSIDIGQVEGAFVQGLGWLTGEEVIYNNEGRLLTHGPSTYKIPAVGDVPIELNTRLLDRAPETKVIGGSKAVGEPPFMLAISVVTALRQAIAAFGSAGLEVELGIPCTPEAILRAVVSTQERSAQLTERPPAAAGKDRPSPS